MARSFVLAGSTEATIAGELGWRSRPSPAAEDKPGQISGDGGIGIMRDDQLSLMLQSLLVDRFGLVSRQPGGPVCD